jgi:hypothetical protein
VTVRDISDDGLWNHLAKPCRQVKRFALKISPVPAVETVFSFMKRNQLETLALPTSSPKMSAFEPGIKNAMILPRQN